MTDTRPQGNRALATEVTALEADDEDRQEMHAVAELIEESYTPG